MFIDTHTHLFSDSFDEDRHEVVQKALNAGVELCLLPNIDVASIQPMKDLVKEFPKNCIPMMGTSPRFGWRKLERRLGDYSKRLV